MAVSINPSSTLVTTVGSSAGQIVDAEDIELINNWMKPVETDEQLVTQWLGPLRKKVNQQTHYIGQSYNPIIRGTLENASASADPTLDLTGDPAALGFKVGHQVFVKEYYPGQTTYFDPTKTTKHAIAQVDAGSVEAAANIAAMAVLVDAKDEAAEAFYRHFSFLPLQQRPARLYLSMKTIIALFGD